MHEIQLYSYISFDNFLKLLNVFGRIIPCFQLTPLCASLSLCSLVLLFNCLQTYPCGLEQNDGYAKRALRRVLLTHAHHIGPHLESDFTRGTQPTDNQTMPFTDIFQIFTHRRKKSFWVPNELMTILQSTLCLLIGGKFSE